MKTVTHFLSSLGLNFVPGAGWLFGDWSTGTALAVYWFESVVASLLVAARIALHQRLSPRQGHVRYRGRAGTKTAPMRPFLGQFLFITLIFSAAHGVFLGVIFLLLTKNGHGAEVGLNGANLLTGCGLVLAILIGNFLVDLGGMRQRPFAWVERQADVNFGRVAVVHLTIIFGMAAVAFTGANRAFFMVFLGLKTMSDLSFTLPQWDPGGLRAGFAA